MNNNVFFKYLDTLATTLVYDPISLIYGLCDQIMLTFSWI